MTACSSTAIINNGLASNMAYMTHRGISVLKSASIIQRKIKNGVGVYMTFIGDCTYIICINTVKWRKHFTKPFWYNACILKIRSRVGPITKRFLFQKADRLVINKGFFFLLDGSFIIFGEPVIWERTLWGILNLLPRSLEAFFIYIL